MSFVREKDSDEEIQTWPNTSLLHVYSFIVITKSVRSFLLWITKPVHTVVHVLVTNEKEKNLNIFAEFLSFYYLPVQVKKMTGIPWVHIFIYYWPTSRKSYTYVRIYFSYLLTFLLVVVYILDIVLHIFTHEKTSWKNLEETKQFRLTPFAQWQTEFLISSSASFTWDYERERKVYKRESLWVGSIMHNILFFLC